MTWTPEQIARYRQVIRKELKPEDQAEWDDVSDERIAKLMTETMNLK